MDMDKIKLTLATLQAAAAAKAATGDAAKSGKENKGADDEAGGGKDAFVKAAELASKAHKAVGALHEHMSGMKEDSAKGMKEDCKAVHKSMGDLKDAVHKAAGVKEDDEKEGSEKAAYGDMMKLLGKMEARLEAAEKATLQPKAAGAGAGFVAVKGGAAVAEGAAEKSVKDMTESEREQARKAALAVTRQMPLSPDVFAATPVETLRAAAKVIELSGSAGQVN